MALRIRPVTTSRYDAFISYSHALDAAIARALQTGVEQFAKPWYRPRALRVFRDTTNLTAGPDLWSSIEEALASSAWLVLMASPDAAQSSWVAREVTWWLEHRSVRRVLVVLTEGELAWNGAAAALPEALRGALTAEPRWVDLRWLRDVDQVDQSNPRLLECVADLAAAVREVPKDFLVGEHVRQHRRTMRLARGGVTALSVLLIAAVGAAAVAMVQRNEAVAAQHTAVARGMTAQAERIRGEDPRSALQLGVAAHRLDPSALTRASLIQTLLSSRYRGTLTGHPDSVYSAAFSPDGHTLAAGTGTTVLLWELTDPTRPRPLGPPLPGPVFSVAFSPRGQTLATSSSSTVILWELTDPTRPRRLGQPLAGHTGAVSSVAFSPDGRTLASASADNDNTIVLWDLTDLARPRQLHEPLTEAGPSVAFSPDGHTLATASADRTVMLWDLTDRTQPHRYGPPFTGPASSVAFSPDRQTLATASADNTATLWELTDPARPRRLGPPLTGHTSGVFSVAFSPDERTLATSSADQTVILWDLTDPARPRRLGPPLTGHSDWVSEVAFSPDGRTLAAATGDTVVLWDLTDRTRPHRYGRPLPGPVASVAFSPDGTPWSPAATTGRSSRGISPTRPGPGASARPSPRRTTSCHQCSRWRSPPTDARWPPPGAFCGI